MSLYEKLLAGSIPALSRSISHIENRTPGYQRLLSKLYPQTKGIYRIGITGPPGAGKSSLVNHLARQLADSGQKVAVICVDPSSPFTGGALLGDRLRMQDIPLEKNVFIRSMGSRGSAGGLTSATSNVTIALDAFGFDSLIIETVGVGQMELDIIDACDTVVVTLVPESGDAIQALKAGLMEIADIFAVNKADRPGAEQMVYDLQSALEMKTERSDWAVPVIATQALAKVNLDLLMEQILNHKSYMIASGCLDTLRTGQIKKKVIRVVERMIKRDVEDRVISDRALDDIVAQIITGQTDPYSAGRDLYQQFKLDA